MQYTRTSKGPLAEIVPRPRKKGILFMGIVKKNPERQCSDTIRDRHSVAVVSSWCSGPKLNKQLGSS